MSVPNPNSSPSQRVGDARAHRADIAVPADTCALAAGLLAEACRAGGSGSQQAKVTEELALDLERQLEFLARFAAGDSADSLVDTALAGADLATLAVCNAAALSEEGAARAYSSVHLAAGAVRASLVLLEAHLEDSDGDHAENLVRDARGAAWRVDLAVRQADDAIKTRA